MKAAAIAWLAVFAACQSDRAPSQFAANGSAAPAETRTVGSDVTAEYRQDIANLCDVERLSGADKLPPGDRAPSIAIWLGPHITTAPGHAFLVTIQPLEGTAKATALDDEAARVGLDGCALADEWRR